MPAIPYCRRRVTGVADLHSGVAVLAPLLGTWSGHGAGEYPTIEPVGYLEEVTFAHVVRLRVGGALVSRGQAVPGVPAADNGRRRRSPAARRDRLPADAVAGPCGTRVGPSDRPHGNPGGNLVEQRNDAGIGVDRVGDRSYLVGQRGDGTEPFDSGRR